jgi:hypothetical protein
MKGSRIVSVQRKDVRFRLSYHCLVGQKVTLAPHSALTNYGFPKPTKCGRELGSRNYAIRNPNLPEIDKKLILQIAVSVHIQALWHTNSTFC